MIEREFVNRAVGELQKGGYVEEAKDTPVVCSPLSVVTNGVGKKRLVVNLRHVNGFLWKQKFKYEDLRVAMMMFEKGEWMFSFDLKSGYHHVDVAQHHRKYLGFEWGGGGGVTFTFVVLPFGLPVARFRTRALYALLESRRAWCDVLLVTQEAGEELRFWVECFDQFNSQPIWHSPAAVCSKQALLGNLEDPKLRRLAQSLPATVLRSRADSTTKKYLGAFQRWKVHAV
ncbi:hypothetical protein EMCRGX_G013331 [Ephydatia muelleri]